MGYLSERDRHELREFLDELFCCDDDAEVGDILYEEYNSRSDWDEFLDDVREFFGESVSRWLDECWHDAYDGMYREDILHEKRGGRLNFRGRVKTHDERERQDRRNSPKGLRSRLKTHDEKDKWDWMNSPKGLPSRLKYHGDKEKQDRLDFPGRTKEYDDAEEYTRAFPLDHPDRLKYPGDKEKVDKRGWRGMRKQSASGRKKDKENKKDSSRNKKDSKKDSRSYGRTTRTSGRERER